MAYATVNELAAALRISVTAANTDALQRCLDAAAAEIDHRIDAPAPVDPDPPWAPTGDGLALAKSDNLNRACEWWKANDFTTPGAPLRSPGGYVGTVLPLKQQWGLA